MLEDRPILRERLAAAATFAAIALGTLAALDFIVTGGFDFGARRTASTYADPLIGAASPVEAAPAPSTVTAVVWTDPELTVEEQPPDDLIDASATPDSGEAEGAPSEDQLYRDIARLYLEEDARDAADETIASGGEHALHGGGEAMQTLYDERDLRPDPTSQTPNSELP